MPSKIRRGFPKNIFMKDQKITFREILDSFYKIVVEVIGTPEADLPDEETKKLKGLLSLFLQQKILQTYVAFSYMKENGETVRKAFQLFEDNFKKKGFSKQELSEFILKNVLQSSEEFSAKLSEKLTEKEAEEIKNRLKTKFKLPS